MVGSTTEGSAVSATKVLEYVGRHKRAKKARTVDDEPVGEGKGVFGKAEDERNTIGFEIDLEIEAEAEAEADADEETGSDVRADVRAVAEAVAGAEAESEAESRCGC
jgi:hypothetical protein